MNDLTLFELGDYVAVPLIRNIQADFLAFHLANPWLYDALVKLAREISHPGHARIGIGMLFEVIRWQWMRQTVDGASDFKMNNNYRSRYARLIMDREPDLADVFQTRVLRAA
jgi:hypothetical protein